MRLLSIIIGVLWLNSVFIGTVQAEETLKVGVKLSEPWVMYDEKLPPEQRQPTGFSIDLWNAIAGELGAKTEWVYFDTMPNLILGAQNKQVDAGISARIAGGFFQFHVRVRFANHGCGRFQPESADGCSKRNQ